MPSALSLRNLCKSFRVPKLPRGAVGSPDPRRRPGGRRHDYLDALRGVSFDIPKGQAVGIVGANGCGKTTLLKILAGVMERDSGTLAINGQVGALLEVGAGFHPDLSGVENVHLSGALLGLSRRETERLLPDIIAFAELERFMDMPVKHYSSGMIVRLGFAIAIQLKPDILLLDETFSVGDTGFQTRALRRIRQLQNEGVTMLLVSHNAELIMELSQRAILLDHGRVAMDGEPHPVLAAYQKRYGAFQLSGGGLGRLAASAAPEAAASPARIVGATIDGGRGEDGLDFETRDALSLQVELDWDAGADLSRLSLNAWFMREDRRAVARTRTPLAELGGKRVTLSLDPLRLKKGTYEITLTISEEGARGAETVLARHMVERRFRVVTPLPYDFLPFEFRLVADIEHQWE